MSNIKRSIEKTKNGKVILQVKVDAADIVTSVDTKLDETAKTLTFYTAHDWFASHALDEGDFSSQWHRHLESEFEQELKETDEKKKWKRNKHYNKYGRILVSQRTVHFVNLKEEFCEKYDLNYSEWVIPLVPKDSASEDSE